MDGCVVPANGVSDAEREVLELEKRLEEARSRLNGLQVQANGDDAVARVPAPKRSPPTGTTITSILTSTLTSTQPIPSPSPARASR